MGEGAVERDNLGGAATGIIGLRVRKFRLTKLARHVDVHKSEVPVHSIVSLVACPWTRSREDRRLTWDRRRGRPWNSKATHCRRRQYESILMQMGQRVRFVPFTLERLESDLLEDKALDGLRREGRSGTSHSIQNREKSET